MARTRIPIRAFSGLNTKGIEDGRAFDEFVLLQNQRLTKDAIIRRAGSQRVSSIVKQTKGVTLNGTTQYITVPIDTWTWELGLKFTVRVMCTPSSKTGTRPIFRAGITTPSIEFTTSSSKLVASVWDSGDTKVSVTSTDDMPTSAFTAFFTRDGADLSLKIDNGTADTNTMSASLSLRTPVGALEFGRDGTNYYAGAIDTLDVFTTVLPSDADRLLLQVAPHVDTTCIGSWVMGPDANDIVRDYSKHRHHGRAINSPSSVTVIAHNSQPVMTISPYRSRSGKTRVFALAGDNPFIAEDQ